MRRASARLNRLWSALAPWFPDLPNAPVLNAVLTSQADQFAFIYQYLKFADAQTRISTANSGWLDLIAWDFFGPRFLRRPSEVDASFAARIKKELLRPRQTKAAISQAIVDLIQTAPPLLLEPWHPADTGVYGPGPGAIGYGLGGRYASLQFPNQIFIDTLHPPGYGIPKVDGYGGSIGGYGVGSLVYADMAQSVGPITNADLYALISQTAAFGVLAWVSIVNAFKVPVIAGPSLSYSGPVKFTTPPAKTGPGFKRPFGGPGALRAGIL
jgi:hypothetical protein